MCKGLTLHQHNATCWVCNPNSTQAQSSGRSLWDPNRFNVAFHWIFFCIGNNQALIQKQAAERGTVTLRRQKGKSGGEAGAFNFSASWKTLAWKMRGGGQCLERQGAPTGAAFSPNQAEPDEPYRNDLENKTVLLDKCWLKGLKLHAEKENIVWFLWF